MNIELNNNNNEYDITKGGITRKDLMELYYVPILLAAYFIAIYVIKKNISDAILLKKIEMSIFFLSFGLFHILARHILSYAYNMQRIIARQIAVPTPLATPRRLLIVGVIAILMSIISLLSG
jgi:hypothetical protein